MACKSGKVPICFCQPCDSEHVGSILGSMLAGSESPRVALGIGPNPTVTVTASQLRVEAELARDSDAEGRRLRYQRAPPSPCRHLAGRPRASPEPASSLRWHEAAARPAWQRPHPALARACPPSCHVACTVATPIWLECELRPAKRSPPHILPSVLSRQEAAGAGSDGSNRRVACIYNGIVVLMTSENRMWSIRFAADAACFQHARY